MTENRLYHRMKIELPVTFEVGGAKGSVCSTIMDISVKGIAAKLKEPVDVGQRFKVAIEAEEDKVLKVDVEVVWIKAGDAKDGPEYTVGFKVVDKMDQNEIEFVRFVAQKMLEYFSPHSKG